MAESVPVDDENARTFLSKKGVASLLSKIPELQGFSSPQLARIAKAKVRYFGPDEFIIREGASGVDQMVIVLAGSVFIYKQVHQEGIKGYEQLAEIHGPTLVGENSFFTGLSRSAGVFARNKTPCLVLDREMLMGLVSLDRASFAEFLRRMATENLGRVERTLVHYMGSLQIVLSGATLTQSGFYGEMEKLKGIDIKTVRDVDDLLTFLKDVLMLLRRLNIALEELYQFANLPEMNIIKVDKRNFTIASNHPFHDVLSDLIDGLEVTQELIPLDGLNVKDSTLNAIIDRNREANVSADYPAVVTQATDAYRTLITRPTEVGLMINVMAPVNLPKAATSGLSKLLWDDI